ncbi:DUF3267 domain-containing protein [Bacillus sp. V59.32b]|uniref:DUF3267 domain-containing protein n=1 Tax=Bacillus sp. V59.32b TaxID=1758642 RepID=UPI000E3E41C9|nr:DUF3267 domain-containing protein [Bacillus sp. V59.32b]RFU62270.1 DUF3267 domain-containing protein [Bacillus sp. V59.32b]
MNCWKSINLTRQYGNQKMFALSLLTMLISFVSLYTFISVLFKETVFYDDYSILFTISVLSLYPVHKLLHYLPLSLHSEKLKAEVQYKWGIVPVCKVKVDSLISKQFFLLVLLMPFMVVSISLLLCAVVFTHYAHYFTILLSLHAGLCVSDFISLKNVIGSPARSFIEENEEGYAILIRRD